MGPSGIGGCMDLWAGLLTMCQGPLGEPGIWVLGDGPVLGQFGSLVSQKPA